MGSIQREKSAHQKPGGDDALERIVTPGVSGQLLGLRDRHGLVRRPAVIGLGETISTPAAGREPNLTGPSIRPQGWMVRCDVLAAIFHPPRQNPLMVDEHAKRLGLEGEVERSIGPGHSLRVSPLVELAVVELGAAGISWRA